MHFRPKINRFQKSQKPLWQKASRCFFKRVRVGYCHFDLLGLWSTPIEQCREVLAHLRLRGVTSNVVRDASLHLDHKFITCNAEGFAFIYFILKILELGVIIFSIISAFTARN